MNTLEQAERLYQKAIQSLKNKHYEKTHHYLSKAIKRMRARGYLSDEDVRTLVKYHMEQVRTYEMQSGVHVKMVAYHISRAVNLLKKSICEHNADDQRALAACNVIMLNQNSCWPDTPKYDAIWRPFERRHYYLVNAVIECAKVANYGELNENDSHMLFSCLKRAADYCNETKPWHIQSRLEHDSVFSSDDIKLFVSALGSFALYFQKFNDYISDPIKNSKKIKELCKKIQKYDHKFDRILPELDKFQKMADEKKGLQQFSVFSVWRHKPNVNMTDVKSNNKSLRG